MGRLPAGQAARAQADKKPQAAIRAGLRLCAVLPFAVPPGRQPSARQPLAMSTQPAKFCTLRSSSGTVSLTAELAVPAAG